MDGVANGFVLGPFDSCNGVFDRRKDGECFDNGCRLGRVQGCKDGLLDGESLGI